MQNSWPLKRPRSLFRKKEQIDACAVLMIAIAIGTLRNAEREEFLESYYRSETREIWAWADEYSKKKKNPEIRSEYLIGDAPHFLSCHSLM